MDKGYGAWVPRFGALLGEPTVHFFVLGAALFLAHRLVVGDARTIVISPGLREDLARRFRDQTGRSPDARELDEALSSWKSEEALYREALRQQLDRDDAALRNMLAGKMRERAAQQAPIGEPSESALAQWFSQNRTNYERPTFYRHEYVSFPKSEVGSEQRRAKYHDALQHGEGAEKLGLRKVNSYMSRDGIAESFGTGLAEQICSLPIGQWHGFESQDSLLLVRMNAVEGGLPSPDELRPQLVSDWKSAQRQKVVDRAVQAILALYRFEERAR